ncbi:SCO family protein [Lacisediminimonas sp.]|uniref:SCO family protein n=1 Tax=Lacisediminimonas sp. TaxID=3060582 RepID=UPI0027162654|nr:SCO family protein [Lacisediminimonas sp.]MDO8298631.1 SCO family protein [Lacisediminimonas sp.]MDO9216412.1 SCO family protein [Lacisediminimonas sp.]
MPKTTSRLFTLWFAPLLAAILLLAGCGEKGGDANQMLLSPVKSSFKNTDVTGLGYARDFSLTDHNGKLRRLEDFRGKAVLMFFGYTQCPDVCPTTMSEMAEVMKQLGPDAERLQVLFVTVDPERDTAAVLRNYVPGFDPRFLGMTGDIAALDKVAKEFRVFYQKVPGKQPGSYTMDHTAGSYVFDAKGRIRLFVRHGQGAEPIAHDIKQLLASGG